MLPQALIDFATRISSKQVVIFAGAGISVDPPSSLPDWFKLNEWILTALYDRVSQTFGFDNIFSRILLDYRNSSNSYPPDYQAQFLEECAGSHYFEALTSLDVEQTNRCHNAIAALAKSGSLAAIVTTNFDRLIERSLKCAGVQITVACDREGFMRLNEKWQQESPTELPVIKIHGSTDKLSSLIDTRKQRRRGRAHALNMVLAHLLRQHPFLFAGFSGADFEHNRSYLGIWDAADISPGFCYLYQPGRPPKKVVFEVKERYGTKAEIIEIGAAEALEFFASKRQINPVTVHNLKDFVPTQILVQGRIRAWADHLDPWLAARMAAALQEAASLRVNALSILKKVVQKGSGDTVEYSLMLADWVKARLRRARYDDIEMRTAIRELVKLGHPLGPYYKFLSDAFIMSSIAGAETILIKCKQFANEYETWLADYQPTLAVDTVLLVCQVASLYGELIELIPALRFVCVLAEQDGDDVRLAAVQAELSVRLALVGESDEAESLIHSALKVSKELIERRVASTALYADALLREQRGDYGEAAGSGHLAYEQAVKDELRFCMSRALLVQLRIACRHGGEGNVDFVKRQINHGFEHEFWAHDLERRLYDAEFAKRCHNSDAASRLSEIADSARRAGMMWIVQEAERLRD